MNRPLLLVILVTISGSPVRAEDWPMFGRDRTRNLVSPEKGAPSDWQAERKDLKTGKVSTPARNIKWSAPLGSVSMGGPVVADGLVWIGTNNGQPRDPKQTKDASVLMCFRESDGKFLWQYVSSRLPSGQIHDWPGTSMPAPLVEGDRLWVVTNRCETLCFDIGPLRRGTGEPKLLWKVDMFGDLGVRPHSAAMASMNLCCIGASHQEWIYVVTGNGVDEDHITIPAPKAPSLIALNKHTGKLLWQDNSPTAKAVGLPPLKDFSQFARSPLKRLMDRGEVLMHGQWTSPLVVEVNGRGQVIVGQGDGWLRSFDPESGKLLWKCDGNLKDAKFDAGGNGTRNDFLATPVLHNGRIYIATGQDPEHYEGVGHLYCIDPTKSGDISRELEDTPGKGKPNPNSGVLWSYGGPTSKEDQKRLNRDWYFGRTQSTVAVQDGLVYAAELAGYLHCVDARTGKPYWVHDLRAAVLGSPLWVDGKVYVCTQDGDVWVFTHGKERRAPRKIDMGDSRGTPIFANGVLYVPMDSRLYAIQETKSGARP